MQTRPLCDKGFVCSFFGEFRFPGSRDPDVVSLSVLLQFSIKKSESVLQERQNKLDYYHEGCNIGYVMC